MTGPRWQNAARCMARGLLEQARTEIGALRTAAPHDVRTLLLAAQLAWREDRIRDATAEALDAAVAVPDDPVPLCATVEMLLQVGEVVAARACLASPTLAGSDDPGCLLRVAGYRQRLDENAEALALTERAIAAGANGSNVRFQYGIRLYFNGRLDDAGAELRACLQTAPDLGRATLVLARLHRQVPDDNLLETIAAGLSRVAAGTPDHAALLFAQYKTLDDLGRDKEAWQALAHANAVMRQRHPCAGDDERTHLDALMSACSAKVVAARGEPDGGPQPIFILGMPRSGTTVLERMLGGHSRVASAGERVDFGNQLHWAADTAHTDGDAFVDGIPELDLAEVGQRYLAQTRWRASGKPFFIDKQPPNWALAGLIHAALPGARILHLVRDPMDVCFSNWRAFFGDAYGYSYDLAALAAHHRSYRRAMAHWHAVMPGTILDVPYADLVHEPQATLRKTLDFCGLEWEPGCIDLQRNQAPVATPSAAQVRAPLHTRAFGQWRRHAEELAPLQAALAITMNPCMT